MRARHPIAVALALLVSVVNVTIARAQQPPPPPEEVAVDERTPPRVSYVDGQVSFWRPGAPEWMAAQINTALAPGDELSTGSPGNFEVQIGARAFVRAWAATGLGLVNQEPDFLQLKVPTGNVSLDLRALDPGRVVEVDTPNAAITIEHSGYYRVLVQGDRTSVVSRRGGRAIVTPASGQAVSIAASEEVVVEGADAPRVASYAAPPLDQWDSWNYARSDYLGEAVSARHVPPGVYGVSDLDRYGRWRVVPEYGSVWVPTAVEPGWVPYSTGSWTWDPYYGWTWVDVAPWGWAPFHYGRWVFVDSYWAWAPGPVIVRPAYSPALVAFLGGGPSVSVRVGWVALGWGEPCIRWWGPPRFVGVPWWGGWGGPRVVNNVVITRTTVVNVQNITVYRNLGVRDAVVVVDHQRFGRGHIGPARIPHVDPRGLEIVRGRLDVRPVPVSLAPTTVRGVRPSDDRHTRTVVATRPPQRHEDPVGIAPGPRPGGEHAPAPRIVPAPRTPGGAVESPRAPIGPGRIERPQPPPPPRLGVEPRGRETPAPPTRQAPPPAAREPRATAPVPATPPATTPRTEQPAAPPPRVERPAAPAPPPRVERPAAPAPPPRVERPAAPTPPPRVERPAAPVAPPVPRVESRPQPPAPRVEPPRPQAPPRVEAPRPQTRPLPGEAADRMSPGRGDGRAPGRPEAPGERR